MADFGWTYLSPAAAVPQVVGGDAARTRQADTSALIGGFDGLTVGGQRGRR